MHVLKNSRNSSVSEGTAFSEVIMWKVVIRKISVKKGQTFIGFNMSDFNQILYFASEFIC